MQCPQCADFLKPDATSCRECGWVETVPSSSPMTRGRGHAAESAAWSPPVPAFREEPWRRERRMTPEEVEPYLEALKAVAAKVGTPDGRSRVNWQNNQVLA